MTTRTNPSLTRDPLLTAALRFARSGWAVFPLQPGTKIPATRHGSSDASADEELITLWWRWWPQANIGIRTGAPGPDVLDIDAKNGVSGFAALSRLKRAGLTAGASAWVRSPSGGAHAYFTGSGQRTTTLPGLGLDFRAAGGSITAPPSVIGTRRYELMTSRPDGTGLDWEQVLRILAPERLAERMARHDRPAGRAGARLDRLTEWVAGLQPGNRNRGCHWAMCRLAEAGLDPHDLIGAAVTCGLDPAEARASARSALRTVRAS